MSEVKEVIQQVIHNPKVAGIVAGMTATMGAAVEATIDWIPDDIGKLATAVGIVLSVILINLHLVGLTKAKFELRVMRNKEAERIAQRERDWQDIRNKR